MTRFLKVFSPFFIAMLLIGNSFSADTAIVVGGGYKLSGSQGQIEKNVKW